ncbi:MAG: hypothetical protein PHO64_02265 [Thiomonas sp.]|nr:hypothetical protein [Thiomonas sp.]
MLTISWGLSIQCTALGILGAAVALRAAGVLQLHLSSAKCRGAAVPGQGLFPERIAVRLFTGAAVRPPAVHNPVWLARKLRFLQNALMNAYLASIGVLLLVIFGLVLVWTPG